MSELDAVIALSQAIRDELISYGVAEHRIAVIPNAVDTERFAPTTAEQRAARRAELGLRDLPAILFVGKLFEYKGPQIAIEALARLTPVHPCQLVVVGPPPNDVRLSQLRRQVDELGLTDLVTFTGVVADPSPWFQAADMFVLPSAREGLANVLVEAAASGLPTVVTNVSGAADAVDDGASGRIVPRDVGDVADALRAYLAEPSLARRHGEAARQLAVARFTRDVVLATHLALFDRILQGRDPGR